MLNSIRAALEQRLAAMSPAIQTAWSNTSFEPTLNVPYQRVHLLPLEPDNPAHDQQTIIDRGIFQVNLCYPVGNGPAAAYSRAEAIRQQYPAGLRLSGVRIEKTPAIARGFIDEERFILPVSIRYERIH